MMNRFKDIHTDNNLDTIKLSFTRTLPIENSRFPHAEQVNFTAAMVKRNQTATQVKALIFTDGTGQLFEVQEITNTDELEVGEIIKLDDGKPCPNGEFILSNGTMFKVWNGKITDIVDPD